MIEITWQCTELHETHAFQFPTWPQRVDGIGSNTQNNAMSSIKMLVSCPQPSHIWMLPNISSVCRSGYFTQFLANKFLWKFTLTSWGVGISKHELFIQIWIFQAISGKKNIFIDLGPPHPMNLSFQYKSWSFVQFLVRTIRGGIDPPAQPPILQW